MKTILIFADWFEPSYKGGGPIRSVSGLATNLNDKFKIKIITSNKDHDTSNRHTSVETNKWTHFDNNVEVIYLDNKGYFLKLLSLIKKRAL